MRTDATSAPLAGQALPVAGSSRKIAASGASGSAQVRTIRDIIGAGPLSDEEKARQSALSDALQRLKSLNDPDKRARDRQAQLAQKVMQLRDRLRNLLMFSGMDPEKVKKAAEAIAKELESALRALKALGGQSGGAASASVSSATASVPEAGGVEAAPDGATDDVSAAVPQAVVEGEITSPEPSQPIDQKKLSEQIEKQIREELAARDAERKEKQEQASFADENRRLIRLTEILIKLAESIAEKAGAKHRQQEKDEQQEGGTVTAASAPVAPGPDLLAEIIDIEV